jgi:hypothetical protein
VGFILSEFLGADEVPGLVGEGRVDGDEVGGFEQLVELDAAGVELLLGVFFAGAVVVQDLHPEAPPAPRDGLPDAAHADDAELLAPHVHAHEELRPPPLPVSRAQGPLGLAEAAGGGEEEHEGGVGGGLVEDARGVGDDDAALSAASTSTLS